MIQYSHQIVLCTEIILNFPRLFIKLEHSFVAI